MDNSHSEGASSHTSSSINDDGVGNDCTEEINNASAEEILTVASEDHVAQCDNNSNVAEPQLRKSNNNNSHSVNSDMNRYCTLTALPLMKQAGHTGYLTFCIVPPNVPRPAPLIQLSNDQTVSR